MNSGRFFKSLCNKIGFKGNNAVNKFYAHKLVLQNT